MRDLSVIQIDAARRARDEKAFRARQASTDERLALHEADLERVERLIERYRLTRGEDRV